MKSRLGSKLVLSLILCFSPGLLLAQNSSIQPESIGGARPIGGNAPAVSGRQGVEVTNNNGNRQIKAKEGDRDIEIILRNDGYIFVNVTRHYGAHQLDALMRRQPALEEPIRAFPKSVEDKDVELSISLTDRYEAPDEESLRNESIVAYNLYKKFTRQMNRTGGSRIQRPGFRGNSTHQIGPVLPGGNGQVPQSPRGTKEKEVPKKGGGTAK